MSKLSNEEIVKYVLNCRREADEAKRDRMALNASNYGMYMLKQDYSHKQEGQSKESLPKLKMAVEQTKAFFQQALADMNEWWRVVAMDGSDGANMAVRPEEIQKLTNYMLKKAKFFSHVGSSVQSALLGSLAITRVYGKTVPKPKYIVKEKGRGKSYTKKLLKSEEKTWELCFDIIRQENYYPDPTGAKLYEVVDVFCDLSDVKKDATGDYPIYDIEAVNLLTPWPGGVDLQEHKKAEETGQNPPANTFRPRVKLTHFLGTVIEDQTGEVCYDNTVITIANDKDLIRKPADNPYWHQKSDIVASPLLEVANSVWHTALCDAGAMLNRSINEIYNLTLDAAMRAIYGVSQIRVNDLIDPSQVSNGIKMGTNLRVSSSLPPGVKVMEQVVTGDIPNEVPNFGNVMQQEFNASMLTSDLRSGVTPFRQVKATEVVETSNTITSVFSGIAKNVEVNDIQPKLELAWMTTAQNWDSISKEEFTALFGKERGEELYNLDPEDVFAATVGGVKFEVFGLTLTLGKQADFKKQQMLLATIGSSEILTEEFIKKYDFGKLLGEVMNSLDIDRKKIEIGQVAAAINSGPAAPAPQGGPNNLSQVPQSSPGRGLAEIFGGGGGFPGSPANQGQGEMV